MYHAHSVCRPWGVLAAKNDTSTLSSIAAGVLSLNSSRAPYVIASTTLIRQSGPSTASTSTTGMLSNGGQNATCSVPVRCPATRFMRSQPESSWPSAVVRSVSCCTTSAAGSAVSTPSAGIVFARATTDGIRAVAIRGSRPITVRRTSQPIPASSAAVNTMTKTGSGLAMPTAKHRQRMNSAAMKKNIANVKPTKRANSLAASREAESVRPEESSAISANGAAVEKTFGISSSRRANGPIVYLAFASAAATSVFSQVNSGSQRPKCPPEAVFW